MVKKKLNEDKTAAEVLGQEPETETHESISDILDEAAEGALDGFATVASLKKKGKDIEDKATQHYNPLFVGPTGAGKTSIIEAWAKENNYGIVKINMMGDALDFLGVKTINRDYELEDDDGNKKKVARVSTVATQAFDPFLRGPMKILFLDEINKTNPTILQSLYDLISFHCIQNGDEVMYLPKLLFTVGAMNPSEYGGGREELDPALKARMTIYQVDYDTIALRKYLINKLTVYAEDAKENVESATSEEEAELWKKRYFKWEGRKDITEALFAEPEKFKWTDAALISDMNELDPILIPRTIEKAIFNCDGTKSNFLLKVKLICGLDAVDLVNNLLANYTDKEHIANKIWDKDYSVDAKQEQSDEEKQKEEIVNSASEEEKEEAAPQKSYYGKLIDKRKGKK